jgi:hypothetical protein
MYNNQSAVAEKFVIYHDLSFFDQWIFRRSLRWVCSDAVSQELLLDFEKTLKEKPLFSWEVFGSILNALSWYNREDHDDRLQDRLPSNRLSEMLQIVLVFISRNQKLHCKYRELILNILTSGDYVGREDKYLSGFSPELYRLEVAEFISILSGKWSGWDQWHSNLETSGNLQLKPLEKNACEVSDPKLYPLFLIEATKAIAIRGWSIEQLGYLEKIAGKVNDLQSFSEVFNDVAPVFGLEATSSLIAATKDLQEFDIYYRRILVQLERWGSNYTYIYFIRKKALPNWIGFSCF